ncbi:unnamed protein product [Mytilus coruscus]|uniref:Uncharacterized protein n=1 Tax=Mytilus coruscus TaxID=42192 RepID=A0A6J8CF47_MYTCO|nr:unnamed protein product [Mytilus coruscus]
MADRNEQSDEEIRDDEENVLPLHVTEPEDTFRNDDHDNHSKCRRCLPKKHDALIILGLVLTTVYTVIVLTSSNSNFTQPSDSRASPVNTFDKTKVPDDLTTYCTPKEVIDGSSVYVKKHQCPGTKLFIPLPCLCDYNVTCLSVNSNTESKTEHYRKRTCEYGTALNDFISSH